MSISRPDTTMADNKMLQHSANVQQHYASKIDTIRHATHPALQYDVLFETALLHGSLNEDQTIIE